jgi:hypothetical protein
LQGTSVDGKLQERILAMTCPSCGSEELEYAEWLAQEDRLEEAEPLLAEARETFERFRARPWLERLNAVGADNGRHATLNPSRYRGGIVWWNAGYGGLQAGDLPTAAAAGNDRGSPRS